MSLLHLFKKELLEKYFEEYYSFCGSLLAIILLFYFPQKWLDFSLCRKLANSYLENVRHTSCYTSFLQRIQAKAR